jgi:hypothetical protein
VRLFNARLSRTESTPARTRTYKLSAWRMSALARIAHSRWTSYEVRKIATIGLMRRSKQRLWSITSSAIERFTDGTLTCDGRDWFPCSGCFFVPRSHLVANNPADGLF